MTAEVYPLTQLAPLAQGLAGAGVADSQPEYHAVDITTTEIPTQTAILFQRFAIALQKITSNDEVAFTADFITYRGQLRAHTGPDGVEVVQQSTLKDDRGVSSGCAIRLVPIEQAQRTNGHILRQKHALIVSLRQRFGVGSSAHLTVEMRADQAPRHVFDKLAADIVSVLQSGSAANASSLYSTEPTDNADSAMGNTDDSATAVTSHQMSNDPIIQAASRLIAIRALQAKKGAEPTDRTDAVYHALSKALGAHVLGLDKTANLKEIGLNELRAIVVLHSLKLQGVNALSVEDITSAVTIGDLILAKGTAHERQSAKIDIDVAAIEADDEEQISELSTNAKLAHFDHYCRQQCIDSLGVSADEVDQVLPATGLQIRFIHVFSDAKYYDLQRYDGRPQAEHFIYNVPDNLDPERLQRAIEATVAQHDCFRTVFVRTTHPVAEYAQVVLLPLSPLAKLQTKEVIVPNPDADIVDVRDTQAWHDALLSVQKEAEAAMTLDKPTVFASYVWSESKKRCAVVLTLYHGIYDGASIMHIREAIASNYAGVTPSTTLLSLRTATRTMLDTDWIGTTMFLMKRFTGVPGFVLGPNAPIALPPTQPKEVFSVIPSDTHMGCVNMQSSLSMDQLVNKAAANVNSSLSLVAQTAWAKVLSKTLTPEMLDSPSGVQFGSVVNGRLDDEAQRAMAPMMANYLAHVPTAKHKMSTNRDICQFLSQQNDEMIPFLHTPCPTTDVARMEDAKLDLPGWHKDKNLQWPYKELDIGFPLFVELWPSSEGWSHNLTFKLIYNKRRPGYEFLTDDWVKSVAVAFDTALADVLDNPDGKFL
ncbi:hypothetical protein VHEMI02517 [[Torrubiella] hemipterigena]|uniref:Condensation domain-containing protein n=1 Tax=[Torrubiella] hemipterigena TaxID=1531966 RepID=A0A0A1T8E7_9HYPO|nr:hypothetical protein VHEMI02517 [[Torrubiella] hemipterigena]